MKEMRSIEPTKVSTARRTIDYATSIADRLEGTANRATGKLAPIMSQKYPIICEEKQADEQWPELFEQLRKELRRIEESQRHIDQTIDLVDL